jgi:hypothetical protein
MLLSAMALAGTGCDALFHLQAVPPMADGAPDAPDPPDAPPDAPAMCPSDYATMAPSGTSRYRLVATSTPFATAVMDCADDETSGVFTGHTHLAVLSDADEATFLYAFGNRWIGLSDLATTGTWKWVTLDPSVLDPASGDTTLWATGEPNNIGTEHCAHFDSLHANHVNNVICTESHAYVCECDGYPDVPSQR